MTLAQYLKRNKISRDEFAALVGVDRVSVWRWENGRVFPLRYIAAITTATGGKVTANDFIRGGCLMPAAISPTRCPSSLFQQRQLARPCHASGRAFSFPEVI